MRVTGGLARTALGFAGGSETTGGTPFALTATVASAVGILEELGRTGPSRRRQCRHLGRLCHPLYFVYHLRCVECDGSGDDVAGTSNAGGAAVLDAGVVNAAQLTLHNYQIQFTSPTQYSVVDQTTSTTLSSGNTYVLGEAISFAGLRVVLANGQQGGPQTGDTFSVSLSPRTSLPTRPMCPGARSVSMVFG